MKSFSIFIIVLLNFISCNSSIAEGINCYGHDGSDQKIQLTLDQSGKVTVNGHTLGLAAAIDGGKTAITSEFISDLGVLSKITLTHVEKGSDDLILKQVNAVTNDVIAEALLFCKRYK